MSGNSIQKPIGFSTCVTDPAVTFLFLLCPSLHQVGSCAEMTHLSDAGDISVLVYFEWFPSAPGSPDHSESDLGVMKVIHDALSVQYQDQCLLAVPAESANSGHMAIMGANTCLRAALTSQSNRVPRLQSALSDCNYLWRARTCIPSFKNHSHTDRHNHENRFRKAMSQLLHKWFSRVDCPIAQHTPTPFFVYTKHRYLLPLLLTENYYLRGRTDCISAAWGIVPFFIGQTTCWNS
eukprot:scpid57304/ scgid32959/ 